MLVAGVVCLEERNDPFAFLDRGLRLFSVDKCACLFEELWNLRVFIGISGGGTGLLTADGAHKVHAKSKDESKSGHHSDDYARDFVRISSNLDDDCHSF